MRGRGGGYRGLDVARIAETGLVRVRLHIDVRDAMGANVLDGAAERVAPSLETISGGRRLMCVLTNDAGDRRAGARFEISVRRLSPPLLGEEAARRLELASRLAQADPSRAVTHNKGAMNGIVALALATRKRQPCPRGRGPFLGGAGGYIAGSRASSASGIASKGASNCLSPSASSEAR